MPALLGYELNRPSSRERAVAASTAEINDARKPPASKAASPAIEVPPGLPTCSIKAAE